MHRDIIATLADYADYNILWRLNISYIRVAYYTGHFIICNKYKYKYSNLFRNRKQITKYDLNNNREIYYLAVIYVNCEFMGKFYYYKSEILNIVECKYKYDVHNNSYNISVTRENDNNIKYTIDINATSNKVKIYSYKWSIDYSRQYHNVYEYSVINSDIYKLAQSRIVIAMRLNKN